MTLSSGVHEWLSLLCDAYLYFLAHAGFECPGDEIRTHPAGRVSYSPPDEPHYVGTVATFTCEGGYVLGEGGSTRRCEIGGWSGTNPTCSKLLVSFKSVQVY